eukprot:TRINITY_DN6762_c0_g2_i1.p1 TRINITY_DN6762_c0_g2~~TRINITY_DN6762_c0_g2_i1.p1  ORF type:complete len:734 (-),score=134.16 TRINITY_DN6762_c0_g2_i1:31-2091(-)
MEKEREAPEGGVGAEATAQQYLDQAKQSGTCAQKKSCLQDGNIEALAISNSTTASSTAFCDPVKPEALRVVSLSRRVTDDRPPPLADAIRTDMASQNERSDNCLVAALPEHDSSLGGPCSGFKFPQPNAGDRCDDGNVSQDCGMQEKDASSDKNTVFRVEGSNTAFSPSTSVMPTSFRRGGSNGAAILRARLAASSSTVERCAEGLQDVEPTQGQERHVVARHSRTSQVRDAIGINMEQVVAFCAESKERINASRERDEVIRRRSRRRRRATGNRKTREYLQSLDKTESSAAQKIVLSDQFDLLCGFMILFNCGIIGLSTDKRVSNGQDVLWIEVAELCCGLFFLLELMARAFVSGRNFLTNRDRFWNMFDVGLVCLTVIDLFAGKMFSAIVTMKALKMMRIVRIFRVFRFFHEMAIFGTMIGGAIQTLMWACAMVTIILYFFAVWFTQAILVADQDSVSEVNRKNAEAMFGTISRSLISLIQAMLDGEGWGTYVEVLQAYGSFVAPVFYIYIVFIRLAALNIITGVFVDQAVAAAQADRELSVMNELVASERNRGELKELFNMIDSDGSRTITLNELEYFFSDDRMVAYFSALGIRAEDMSLLFTLLDADESGQVDSEEFVEGCSRLKGVALRVDVAFILRSIKQVHRRLLRVFPEGDADDLYWASSTCGSARLGSTYGSSYSQG